MSNPFSFRMQDMFSRRMLWKHCSQTFLVYLFAMFHTKGLKTTNQPTANQNQSAENLGTSVSWSIRTQTIMQGFDPGAFLGWGNRAEHHPTIWQVDGNKWSMPGSFPWGQNRILKQSQPEPRMLSYLSLFALLKVTSCHTQKYSNVPKCLISKVCPYCLLVRCVSHGNKKPTYRKNLWNKPV